MNPFLTSIHCVAQRINLAALEASKTASCEELSLGVDHVLNALAGYFNKSSKRKSTLQALQDELNDAKKTFKRYYKIRWLSRFEAVSTLCDSLEYVFAYLRDSSSSPSVVGTHVLYNKLREFKFIYVLNFLADILQMLGKLSKIFQCKLVGCKYARPLTLWAKFCCSKCTA